jgi:hypothetical protein
VGPSPTLSQLLKQAKTEGAAALIPGEGGELDDPSQMPPNYSRFFEEYHGMCSMVCVSWYVYVAPETLVVMPQ